MAATYELKKTASGQWMFNLKAANGEVILTSEQYHQKGSAEKGIASVRANSPVDGRYDRRESVAGEPYFVLKARNHEIIGTSEMYSSDSARDRGMAAVRACGAEARVVEVVET